MAQPPNSCAHDYQFTNVPRPLSSTGLMSSIPCTTPRRNTSRQEWIDMAATTQNYNPQSGPQIVMSPTEQIGTRLLPSETSHYGATCSTLNRRSMSSIQQFPMAFDAQTPSNTPGPSAFSRLQNNNNIGTTSSFGIHGGIASQMSIPFSPITVPDFRRYDQSPVILY